MSRWILHGLDDFYKDSRSISIGTHELVFWISQMCIPSPLICNWFSLVFINFYRFPLMFHGFNTFVSPESSGEVWGGLGSSREVWGGLGRSGELWTGPGRSEELQRGPGRSGEVWGAPERSGEIWGGLGGPGSSWEVRGGLGSSQTNPNHQILEPKSQKSRKSQSIFAKTL